MSEERGNVVPLFRAEGNAESENLECEECGNQWMQLVDTAHHLAGVIFDAKTGRITGYSGLAKCIECGHPAGGAT